MCFRSFLTVVLSREGAGGELVVLGPDWTRMHIQHLSDLLQGGSMQNHKSDSLKYAFYFSTATVLGFVLLWQMLAGFNGKC